ncbi:MAG: benzoate--CoA ligase, partial [Pseudomonadota bacterium]
GYRVSPQEVEEALSNHPSVDEVAVTQVTLGNELTLIAAFVVSADPDLTDADLVQHAGMHLAPYKCPKIWMRRDSLPRTANGKLIRRILADSFTQGSGSDEAAGQR